MWVQGLGKLRVGLGVICLCTFVQFVACGLSTEQQALGLLSMSEAAQASSGALL